MTGEFKVIRRKHMVKARVGMRAADFLKAFEKIPPDATVDEVIDDRDGNDSIFSIEFHEEELERD
jgi:hypothetical protein